MQGLDDAQFRLAPARAAASHPPQVDDVSDEEEAFAAQMFEEGREFRRVAVLRAQVAIRYEGGAELHSGGLVHADPGHRRRWRTVRPRCCNAMTATRRRHDMRAAQWVGTEGIKRA